MKRWNELQRAVIGLVMLVLLLFAGCAQAEPVRDDSPTATPAPTPPAPQLFLQNPEGQYQEIDSFEEFGGLLPFDLIMPTHLPYGMHLKRAGVNQPPSIITNEENRRRQTRVVMAFGNDEETAGFMLTQGIIVGSFSGEGETIRLNGVEATYYSPANVPLQAIEWEGCGIVFSMTAGKAGNLDKEDLIRIAGSTLEGC